jgi:thiol:disulfide interchange protein DsbD
MILKKKNLLIILYLFLTNLYSINITWKNISQEKESGTVEIICDYETNKYILSESIKAKSEPFSQQTSVIFDHQPDEMFIPKEQKPLYVITGTGKFKFIIPNPEVPIESIIINYSYYDIKKKKIIEKNEIEIKPNILSDNFNPKIDSKKDFLNKENTSIKEKNINLELNCDECLLEESDQENDLLENENIEKNCKIDDQNNIQSKLVKYMQQIDNEFLLSIIIFIFGILMSLTPCSYPMIPITLGIFGLSEESVSRRKILFKATAYAIGVALIFSILGILAISGSMIIGGLFSKKWFIFLITIFLGYMTFGMIGFYEIYSPNISFSNKLSTNNPLMPFIFGIISGSVASPCVSPGLFAILTIAAEKGSYFSGFLFLFIFGLGLSFPLWLIAVIFKNINSIPKAGIWMIQIKQIIGFIILFIWGSYAKIIVKDYIINIIIIFICFLFLYKNFIGKREKINKLKLINLIVLLFCTFIISFYSYDLFTILKLKINKKEEIFTNNFYNALINGKKENKFLFVYATASWCTSCKNIYLKHFKNEEKLKNLLKNFIFVKIDCTNYENNETQNFLDTYEIQGIPMILLINPNNEKIISKYNSEIINFSTEEFINKLNNDLKNIKIN